VRERAHGLEVATAHRRQHDLHARCACALNHVVAVGVEFRRVEVAVGVDPATFGE
jgi:hypothetical protein